MVDNDVEIYGKIEAANVSLRLCLHFGYQYGNDIGS